MFTNFAAILSLSLTALSPAVGIPHQPLADRGSGRVTVVMAGATDADCPRGSRDCFPERADQA